MSKNAFATIHFGSNPVYLELELYFFIMLRKYTKNDILYLYSVNDTPPSFVEAVRPLVTEVIPYDDKGITYDVNFESGYSNFNTLRTCNFIFAYTLEKYETICIIESDMVIMRDLDSIFRLNGPAVLTYHIGDKLLKTNDAIQNDPKDVLSKCNEMGRTNGGVMLIKPSMRLFETYRDKIKDVVKHTCKYPNETLFEYVNNSYFNMPIQYNLSHFLAKPHIIKKYGLAKDEIVIFHFNETKFKHIDIIKNPVDETGINWLENPDPKYAIKRNAVMHYKDTVYDKHPEIKEIISGLSEKPKKTWDPVEVGHKYKLKCSMVMDPDKWEEMSRKARNLGKKPSDAKYENAPFDWKKKKAEKNQNTEKNQKWIDRIDSLIERISAIDSKENLEKFNVGYIKPIHDKKSSQDKKIQEHIDLLLNAYQSKMETFEKKPIFFEEITNTDKAESSKTESPKKAEFQPVSPPQEDFLRKFGKDEFITIYGEEEYDQKYKKSLSQEKVNPLTPEKTESLKVDPISPPREDFLKVFGKEEFINVYGKEEYDQKYKKSLSKSSSKKSSLKKSSSKKSSSKKSSLKKDKQKVKKTQKCKEDEEINPETGRCRKVCPPGTTRNEKGKCVKTANKTQKVKESEPKVKESEPKVKESEPKVKESEPKAKSPNKTQKVKECKEDEELNPETGRCRKKCPEGKVRNEKGNCVNPK
jgi:hypothetical protein